MNILVTGATGYIGGRLIPKLLKRKHTVTVLVRDKKRIKNRSWYDLVSVIEGDLLKKGSWERKLKHFDVAYYLVHSLYSGNIYDELDRRAALNFSKAIRGIKHVIYLGGLLPEGDNISKHLKSRAETGKILRENLPVTEFRAGPIIGSGSASFEMVRYLVERLPVMITPRWVHNQIQPIAIRDVLSYLEEALKKEPLGIIPIGAKSLSFKEMMLYFAKVRKLKRFVIPIPLLTPTLASHWVGLITPLSSKLARPLIKGIVHPITGNTKKAHTHFPKIKPISYRRAVALALKKVDSLIVETRWTDALGWNPSFYYEEKEGLIREERTRHVNAKPETLFKVFSKLGGQDGWLVWNWTWKLRGLIDIIVGGPGLSRGRRKSKTLHVGDALDFWRIEALGDHFMLLRAEMKVPGKAWLHLRAEKEGKGSRFIQTAIFQSHGLWGFLYWYALYPIHLFIFSDMAKAIAKRAEVLEWED